MNIKTFLLAAVLLLAAAGCTLAADITYAFTQKDTTLVSQGESTIIPAGRSLEVRETGQNRTAVTTSDGIIGTVNTADLTFFTVKDLRGTKKSAITGFDPNRVPWSDFIELSEPYAGTVYDFGGTTPAELDCSAFVRRIYRLMGRELPRNARDQANVGVEVPRDLNLMKTGDRLYFASPGSTRISHTGIYAGNGMFLHCNEADMAVSFSCLAKDRYWKRLVKAVRFEDQ